jgi:SAM-dependent methyltransferase
VRAGFLEAAPSDDSCPACGAAESRVLFSATDRLYQTTSRIFQVVECRQCRLIRLHPQPSPRELRQYYPPEYWFIPHATAADRLEQIYRRFVLRDHLRFVARALRDSKEEGIVLDVGCGGGLFLAMLADCGAKRVLGLDFSLDAAHAAWRRSGVPAICATLSSAPLPPSSCAAISMFHVLEHLYDPAAYLQAAHRLLRPEGRLIVQVPNAACWQFLLFGERWNGIDVPRHLINFRERDLRTLLDDCGFEVVRTKHFSLRDNPAGMATTLAPDLDPMARRVRRTSETPREKLWKDLIYLVLSAACAPFTLLEAACRAGSTIMVEARKKSG